MTGLRARLLLVSVLLAPVMAQANPRSDYLLECGGCHLENGQGSPPEVPDLRRDLDWLARSPAGRSYLSRVPGASQVPLSDARLAAVFNWILSTYYPQQPAIQAFTGEEISATRGIPLYDPLKARQALTEERAAAH